jgi:glycosyltransferase involved in cell wall biosynthesis
MTSSAELLDKVATTSFSLPENQISDAYKGLNVLGLVADNGACGHYRVINPLHILRQHGATVTYSEYLDFGQFLESDNILAPRQHAVESYEMFRMMQWEGKKVHFEIDDNLHTVLRTSPAYSVYYPGSEALKWLEKFMVNAHGITVTTPELKEVYKKYNKNIHVVGNYIDFSLRDWGVDVSWDYLSPTLSLRPITRPEEWEDKVVIGWSGGASHLSDLVQIITPISQILAKYPNTMFAYYGNPELFVHLNEDKQIPEDRLIFIEPRHFLDHPKGLFGIDIGLAPILGCEFNISKSPLKILEGWAAGQAMVASNVGPYARLGKAHPEAVLLVGEGKDCYKGWYEAIEKLVVDNDFRKERQRKNRELVVTNYSLEQNFHRWPQAWGEITKNASIGNLGPMTGAPSKLWGTVGRNDACPCGSGAKYKKCCNGAWG